MKFWQKEDKQEDYYGYINKRYNRVAPHYEKSLKLIPFKDVVRNKFASYINSLNPKKVVEVGAGTGEQTLLFNGKEVHGIDISKEMIDLAKKKGSKIKFGVMDATNTSFKNNYFDVVCSVFSFHEMPKEIREKAVREMKRISNRWVVIMDYSLPNNILKIPGIMFIDAYECRYYKEFVRLNMYELFNKSGLKLVEEVPLAFGFVKIWKCKISGRK